MSRAQGNASTNGTSSDKSYFEQQRAHLLRDIGVSMEQVLQNLNKLNRSLEGVIAVGNEFTSVEALWSHFENIMAKDPQTEGEENTAEDSEAQTRQEYDSSKQ
ncbi:MAG: hypothetical protein M1831_002757 [Alyxoria varia]|nr:MAG: hypothetical protein M1831_002757 [Alyxoria varia]